MLIKQKGRLKTPKDRLNKASLTLNFLNVSGNKTKTAAGRHWVIEKNCGIRSIHILQECVGIRMEPAIVLRWEHGFVYVSTGNEKTQLTKIRFNQGRPSTM